MEEARIDKWLWAARIFKTRSIAVDAIKNSRVTIGGMNVKPSRMVKVGDIIKIIEMLGEPRYTGKTGVVEHIDSLGQLHGSWGGLAVQPENDRFEVIGHK